MKLRPDQIEYRQTCARKVFFIVKYYRGHLMKITEGTQFLRELTNIRVRINTILTREEAQAIEHDIQSLLSKIQKRVLVNIGFRDFVITHERVFIGRCSKEAPRLPPSGTGYSIGDQVRQQGEEELMRLRAKNVQENDFELDTFQTRIWKQHGRHAGNKK